MPRSRTHRQAAFLDALRAGKSVSAACADVGIARPLVYEWRGADPAFGAAWAEALDEGTDRMEDEAYRRAVDGTSKPVYQGGELVGHVQEYSDTLMIFLLKARRPDKYRERVSTEVSGLGGRPIQIAEAMTDEQLAAIASGGGGRASKA